jgi:hypothetical protein
VEVYRFVCRVGCELLIIWLVWQYLAVVEVPLRQLLAQVGKRQKRQMHPQSPKDCPACRAQHKRCEVHVVPAGGKLGVEAWGAHKGRRGRRKVVATDGHACSNAGCAYYNITDGQVHALVGNGKHYGADTIQYLKCQACGTKVSTRWNTPMYDLKTPARRVEEVMTATSEGLDVAAAHRVFQHDERTIQRWLSRTAYHAQRLHNHFFRNLVCQHLQLDELVTKLRGAQERVFVWVALDAQTKLIPVIHIGGRKREDAQCFVHELWQRLAPCAPRMACGSTFTP